MFKLRESRLLEKANVHDCTAIDNNNENTRHAALHSGLADRALVVFGEREQTLLYPPRLGIEHS